MDDTAVLARVSTKEQAKGGHSLKAQLDYVREFCRKRNWGIMGEYVQEGGHSDDLDYPALLSLLTDVCEGKVRRVVVQYTDRLARGDNFPFLIQWLWDQNVDIYASDFPEGREDAAEYVASMQGTQGKMFLKKLRQRTVEGVAEAKLAGKHVGRPVAGFEWQDGHLVPDETKRLTWAARRNRRAWAAGGEESLMEVLKESARKSIERVEIARTRKMQKQKDFKIWLEQNRPLKSGRAGL